MEIEEEGRGPQLVLCFREAHAFDAPIPSLYMIQSFPLIQFLRDTTLDPLQSQHSSSLCHSNIGMSLLRYQSEIYAFGGYKSNTSGITKQPEDYSTQVYTFPLQKPIAANSSFTALSHMNYGKCFPIVVDIDGIIYVLSKGVHHREIPSCGLFEAFDPATGVCTLLPPCPFHIYLVTSHFVHQSILYVSTSRADSMAFDTRIRKWVSCNMFLDFAPANYKPFTSSSGAITSPPFPFGIVPAIYDDRYILCDASLDDFNPFSDHSHSYCPIKAFEIVDDDVRGVKATQVEFQFDVDFETFHAIRVFHLHGRLFMAFLRDEDRGGDFVKIVTFMLQVQAANYGRKLLFGKVLSMHHSSSELNLDGKMRLMPCVDAFIM